MKPVLLDTHVFVWLLTDTRRVPERVWGLVRDPSQELCLSVASAWELAVKAGLGRIDVPNGVQAFVAEGCRRTNTRLLGIELAHVAVVGQLPHHHRDPFDRMLVAQAKVEGMALLTFDRAIDAYDVARA